MRSGGVRYLLLMVLVLTVLVSVGPLAAQEGDRPEEYPLQPPAPEETSEAASGRAEPSGGQSAVPSAERRRLEESARTTLQTSAPLVAQATPQAAPQPTAPKQDALVLYRQGKFQEAINVCLQEIQEQPRRMDAYAVLGWSLLRLNRHSEVLTYGKRALSISRYDIRIIEQVGEANFHLGNNLEALKYFEEYVAYAANGSLLSDVYYFMGEIFIRLEEYRHAEISYTAALNFNPRVAIWWSRLGYVREAIEQPDFALEAYNRALQINPRLGDAQQGKLRMQQKLANG